MKTYTAIIFSLLVFSCNAQNETKYLTKAEITNDLNYLDEILQSKSSYQGLNGYEYKKDFDAFLKEIDGKQITKHDFQLFLSKSIGKIGDRHSYIKGDRVSNLLYLPIAFAPFKDKVLGVDYHREKKEYGIRDIEFPFLKSINNIPIEKLIPQILPGKALAPKSSYFAYAVKELTNIQTIFKLLNIDLPNPLPITLTNEKGVEKKVNINLVARDKKGRRWYEQFYIKNLALKEEQYNDKAIIERFFTLENNIGYIQITDMIEKEESPIFFESLNDFMMKAKNSDALIIDVRHNGGGTRDLIQELAGYFINPDSVYVVNATKQRGKLPLNNEIKETLHGRFLHSIDELNTKEQNAVNKFMTTFNPMYDLDNKRFSEYYYYVLNGQKLTKNKYHYNKPIYILANEKSFSAASILVSVFKGLPNIKIVGVNTDGSSGNSKRFELPNSELRGKISTMVSFQKDGSILDGIGTKPDILIERNLDQIFWKEDYQLNKLKQIIKKQSK